MKTHEVEVIVEDEDAEEEVDPEFSQSEASDVNESAEEAPKAEDTVDGGGE